MEETNARLKAHGLSMDFGAGMMIVYFLLGFIFGIVAVWLYAAIRPRYGPGPKTAIIAGFVLWVIGYLISMIGYASIGLYTTGMITTWLIFGFVEIIIATLLGAWIYKEEEASPV